MPSSVSSTPSARLGLKDAETRLTFNLHVVEHMLQSFVPAAGRNSKGPAELIEVLQDLAARLKAAAPCLKKEIETIVDNVYDAFRTLKGVEDLDEVDRASAALARMEPENVSGNHIFTPLVNVVAFMAAVRQASSMVDSKRKYLGNTRIVHLAHKTLSDFNIAEIKVTAKQTFKSLFVRSVQYVHGLKSKGHQDVNNFQASIGCMLDKAAEWDQGNRSVDWSMYSEGERR